jgi:hypothetical protein
VECDDCEVYISKELKPQIRYKPKATKERIITLQWLTAATAVEAGNRAADDIAAAAAEPRFREVVAAGIRAVAASAVDVPINDAFYTPSDIFSKALKLEASNMIKLGYLMQEDCPLGMYDLGMQFACEADVLLWDRAIKHVYGHFHGFAGQGHTLGDYVSPSDCKKYFHPPEASFSPFLVVV